MNTESTNEEKFYCSECDAEINSTTEVCPNCGADLSEFEEEIEVPYGFNTLLYYGAFLSIAGWIIIVVGIILTIIFFTTEVATIERYAYLGAGIFLLFVGCFSLINGELITCFVSIEKNTRETNKILTIKLNKLIDAFE